ncbi:MAG: CocE/NonD family hydrolase [Acidimicrobiia bacterium]|nr:CocE/NonD family hydrolase [Acidimicrobiia bacterium]
METRATSVRAAALFLPLLLGACSSSTSERTAEADRVSPAAPAPAAPAESQPIYPITVDRNLRVNMRDGVELSTDVVRPNADGTFPVLMMRTPYGKDWSAGISGGPYEHEYYATRGYVVVQQDSRGRFDSSGVFEPFVDEAPDGWDTAAWAAQQPWSNARLAGLGQSYYGYSQLALAVQRHPALVTIAPLMTTGDTHNNWIFSDGAMHLGFAMAWGTGLLGRGTARPNPRVASPPVAGTAQASVFAHLPVQAMDEQQGQKMRVPFYRAWLAHPTKDDHWMPRSLDLQVAAINVPTFFYTGWYDYFLRGNLADYERFMKIGSGTVSRTGTRLIIGPWMHYTGRDGATAKVGDLDFGPSAAYDLPKRLLGWYDQWLKGMPDRYADDGPVKIFVMGDNAWRSEKAWPLADAQPTKYYFSSGGKANTFAGDGGLSTTEPSPALPTDVFVYDPANPVPTVGGVSGAPTGPRDQSPLATREDILSYTSAPLASRVEVTGPIQVKLFAATDAPDTDFTAKLVDVHPDGRSYNIQDGIIRARYRLGLDKAVPIKPGEVLEYTIDLWSTSHAFLPGHRVRVDIASSNFPRLSRNLNTGQSSEASTKMRRARQTIYHDAAHPSHIMLPIVPNGARPTP